VNCQPCIATSLNSHKEQNFFISVNLCLLVDLDIVASCLFCLDTVLSTMLDPIERRSAESEMSLKSDETMSGVERSGVQNMQSVLQKQFSNNSTAQSGETYNGSNGSGGGGGRPGLPEIVRSNSNTSINSISGRRRKGGGATVQHTANTLNYRGTNIYQAAAQGNLPLCVMLWGMGSSKRVSLMVPDFHGNNPMHYAVMAETPEVSTTFLLFAVGWLC
jgi:hypothetical protein